MVTATQKRKLGRERTRRYREKQKRRRRDRAHPGAHLRTHQNRGRAVFQRMGGSHAPNHGRAPTRRPVADDGLATGTARRGRCAAAGSSCLRAAAQSGKSSSVGLALGGARLQLGQPVLIVATDRAAGSRRICARTARTTPRVVNRSRAFLHGERHGGLGRSAAVLYRTATTGGSVSLAGAEISVTAQPRAALQRSSWMRSPAIRCTCGREGSPIMPWRSNVPKRGEKRAPCFSSRRPLIPGDPFDEWYAIGRSTALVYAVRALWRLVDADMGACRSQAPRPRWSCPSVRRRARGRPRSRGTLLDAGQWRPTVEADDPEVLKLPLTPLVFAGLGPGGDRRRPSTRHARSDRWRPGRGPARRSRANRTRTCPDVGPIQATARGCRELAAGGDRVHRGGDRRTEQPARNPHPRDARPIASWGAVLDYHVTRGRPTEAAVWKALQSLWDDAGVRVAAVDSGYLPAAVRALAHRDTRCLPVVGRAGVRQPIAAPGGSGWCYVVGVDGVKRDLLGKVDSSWLRLPAAPWCTRSWLHSLTAEHEEVVERSGRRVTVWRQHYRRNEALDCATYALAIAELVPRPRRRRPRLVRV